jgi:hypothetical protein
VSLEQAHRPAGPELLAWALDPAPLLAALDGPPRASWRPCDEAGDETGGDEAPAPPGLALISVAGGCNFDYPLAGPLRPTPDLLARPVLASALAQLGLQLGLPLGLPLGRARALRLAPASEARIGVGTDRHWLERAALGLVLAGAVELEQDGRRLTPEPGRGWRLTPRRPHRLRNRGPEPATLLVVELHEHALVPPQPSPSAARSSSTLPLVEPHLFEVLEPAAFEALCAAIEVELDERGREQLAAVCRRWAASFSRFGHTSAGELDYRDHLLELRERILPKLGAAGAGRRAASTLLTTLNTAPTPASRPRATLGRAPRRPTRSPAACTRHPRFDRPLFILSPPRSGSTLLFDLLARLPGLWTIGGESHELIRGIPSLHPAARGYASDCLGAAEATPEVAAALRAGFARRLLDHRGQALDRLEPPRRPTAVRLLEKTPANALRVPFLRAVFPDAQFLVLHRDPRATIGSLVEGWRSRRFIAYCELPGWPHRGWSFLLPPSWRACIARPLVEIASFQWRAASEAIAHALANAPASAVLHLRYAELVEAPASVLTRVASFTGLDPASAVALDPDQRLPLTHVTLSPPDPDKWRRHEHELAQLLPRHPLERDPWSSTIASANT